jgi:hypothetical protein
VLVTCHIQHAGEQGVGGDALTVEDALAHARGSMTGARLAITGVVSSSLFAVAPASVGGGP